MLPTAPRRLATTLAAHTDVIAVLVYDPLGARLVEIRDHDTRALAGESEGGGTANARRGAGHDGDLVLEPHRLLSPTGRCFGPFGPFEPPHG